MTAHEFGGGWTEQKLQVLDDYLTAYCKIFERNQAARHFETIYVDAFAGGGLIQSSASKNADLFGEFAEQDAINFLQGSAARALHHSFDRYLFIDKSDERIAELEKLRARSPACDRIVIRKGKPIQNSKASQPLRTGRKPGP